MGQKNSQIIAQGSLQHERLGVIKVQEVSDIFNEHDNVYRLQLKKNLESEEKFFQWHLKLQQIDSDQAREVLYLPLSLKYEKTAICGSGGVLTVNLWVQSQLNFEHFPYVLKSEIKNRRKMSQYFQESQLWYLFYNLVEAGTIFERKNKKLGDIHPNNCLLNENGQFKIISSYSIPDQSTNYDKIIDSPTADAFLGKFVSILAPEEIDHSFLEKGIYPNVDCCKAEVYCIGMTLLEAATLEDCFYTYNRGPYKINKKRLADLLKIAREKYRKPFYDYLFNMLDEQVKRRKKSSQIFNELRPFEDAILQLREFSLAGDLETQAMGRTIDQNEFTDQSSIPSQKGNLQNQLVNNEGNYSINSKTYINSGGHRGYPTNATNQKLKYTQPQFQNQNLPKYGTITYSNTSIDNGLRR